MNQYSRRRPKMTDLAKHEKDTNSQHDQGLSGLVTIVRYHQVPITEDDLRHQFRPPVKELGEQAFFGDQEILLAAKSLGFKAKIRHLDRGDIDSDILPALGKRKNGGYFILAQKVDPPPSAVAKEAAATLENEGQEDKYLVQWLDNPPRVEKLTWEELCQDWDGEAILLTPRRSPFFGQFKKFNLKWFLPALVKYRHLFSDVLVASLLVQIFGLVTPLFFQLVMDKVLVHKALTTLQVLGIGFIAASVFEVCLNMVRDYIFDHTTNRMDVQLGSNLFHHLTSLPLAWFQARQAGQSVARVRELDSLRNFITSSALTLVIDLSFTVIYFVVMWFYSPTLTYIVLASIPCYVILSLFITPILKHRLDKKFENGAANQSFLVESVTGIETIKSLALESQKQKRWENMLASYVSSSFRVTKLGKIAGHVASLIQKLTTLGIIWFGAHQVMSGDLTVGQLVAFNMIAGRISGPILKLTQLWQDFQQAGISLKRLGDILNTRPEQLQSQGLGILPSLKGAVKFVNVRFRYHSDSPVVINDLSMDIRPGEIIGLVGHSGSGKSTIAKLIQRLYQAESGRILVDGADLTMVHTGWLRRQIGVVLQENVLFNGTIRENIAISNPAISMERVIAAAQMAGAHDFIMELSENYNTQVGERGGSLSGGQRQRLAIARVLIGDPRILIFDEATSALDYESERIIQDNMGRICQNRTVFIIAHRLSAVRIANRIMVMDKGCLVESGTTRELMERKGHYYKMVMSQDITTGTPRSRS
jgi:subfamily B ATP-binding cassette protein HlyB/CyaB